MLPTIKQFKEILKPFQGIDHLGRYEFEDTCRRFKAICSLTDHLVKEFRDEAKIRVQDNYILFEWPNGSAKMENHFIISKFLLPELEKIADSNGFLIAKPSLFKNQLKAA